MSSTKGYGQFCPVALASEVLTERWVPLIVRELLSGSTRFGQLQRGLPRISSAMLSRRLKELEIAGVIEIAPAASGHGSEYRLTRAGEELAPIVQGMGIWAQRWMRTDLTKPANLDPDLLMWDIRRTVQGKAVPAAPRHVVEFRLDGVPVTYRRYWLVFEKGEADLCTKPPGFDVDLAVTSHIRDLTAVWLGHEPVETALRRRRLSLDGSRTARGAFRDWFTPGYFSQFGQLPAAR